MNATKAYFNAQSFWKGNDQIRKILTVLSLQFFNL